MRLLNVHTAEPTYVVECGRLEMEAFISAYLVMNLNALDSQHKVVLERMYNDYQIILSQQK